MQTGFAISMVISLTYVSSVFAVADNLAKEKFERLFFEPQVASRFGIDVDRFRSLSPKQRNDLLDARSTLMQFFIATQELGKDPRQFLGASLAERFKNRQQVGHKLFGLETQVKLVSVFDFKLIAQDLLQLRYYIVIFSEGALMLREDWSKLRRIGRIWKIVRIGDIE